MEWRKLQRIDPLVRQAERGEDAGAGLSPMDPPDAYAPPGLAPVPVAELHPFLGKLGSRHGPLKQEIAAFEETILSIRKTGYTRQADARLKQFFHFFDGEFASHNRRDMAALFALLHQRLMEHGEHSKAEFPTTAVDLMQDEYAKALQLAAVIVNFLALAFRLPDERSRLVVLDAALEESKNLVELLRLLLFRVENVVFSLAHRLISAAELDQMQLRAAAAESAG